MENLNWSFNLKNLDSRDNIVGSTQTQTEDKMSYLTPKQWTLQNMLVHLMQFEETKTTINSDLYYNLCPFIPVTCKK